MNYSIDHDTGNPTISAASPVPLTCYARSYIRAQALTVLVENVTIASGTMTTFYLHTLLTTVDTTTLGSTYFVIMTNVTEPIGYVITGTSYNSSISSSVEWTISLCTYLP